MTTKVKKVKMENTILCPYCGKKMKPAPEFGAVWYKCKCGATHNIIGKRRRK